MRALLVAVVFVSACYAPHAPGGSYRCGEGNACPSGLDCTCGLCVSDPKQAACSFTIEATTAQSDALTVAEHEPFPITVTALDEKGEPATAFHGDVTLSSTWGDVCVGTSGCIGLPDKVHMTGGQGAGSVQLNRETNAPQTAILRATFGANVGSSGTLRLTVQSLPAVRSAKNPIIAPASGASAYGYVNAAIGAPFVVKTADAWNLYFLSLESGTNAAYKVGIGVTSSSSFDAFAQPPSAAIAEASFGMPNAENLAYLGAPSAYTTATGTSLFYGLGKSAGSGIQTQFETIVRSDSTSAAGPFAQPVPILRATDLGADSINFPVVIADPRPDLSGGGPASSVAFFSSVVPVTLASGLAGKGQAVQRAFAKDGQTFVVDPAAVITSTVNERVVLAPRILVDGTVFKMWYSYASDQLTTGSAFDPCSTSYRIGYATSDDGYYWIRSPANLLQGTLGQSTKDAWENAGSPLVGSVLPVDGADPASGIAIYYSVFQKDVLTGQCIPNGVGIATIPTAGRTNGP